MLGRNSVKIVVLQCTLGYEYEDNEYKDVIALAMLAANRYDTQLPELLNTHSHTHSKTKC